MNSAATRQDVQLAFDRTKSSIMGSMFSRNDAQSIISQVRTSILQDLRDLHAENQSGIRMAQTQHEQMIQRITMLQQQVNRMSEQQTQLIGVIQQMLTPSGTMRRY